MVQRHRFRPKIERRKFIPQPMRMDRGATRWLYKYAHENHWRVASWIDLDDLIQDGFMLWTKVATRYLATAKDRPHMMRLFQTTFKNHVHGLANQRRRDPNEVYLDDLAEDDNGEIREPSALTDHGEHAEETVMLAQLAHAPDPIRRLLALVSTEDGRRRLRALYRRRPGGVRETLDERICRLVGLPGPAPNFREMMRQYLELPDHA